MAVIQERASGGHRFILRPNCSLSWQTTKALIWFFAACLTAVGAYFATLGAWLVFPFAGLELGVLVAGFYLSALAGHTREEIEIDGPVLRVSRGGRRLEEVACFPANWTRVSVRRDTRGWYPSRLMLHCHGKGVEVGGKLVEAEREELADMLRDLLDFRLPRTGDPDAGSVPADLGLPAQTRQRVGAVLDADAHARTGLAPEPARRGRGRQGAPEAL